MKYVLFLGLCLAQWAAYAQEFESDFNDGNFCEFDLQRMPLPVNANGACEKGGLIPWAKMVHYQDRKYVDVTLSSTVPFTKKYLYKMELSMPDTHRYRDTNRTEHRFSIVVPRLPAAPKIFDHLHENATAFVLAQWHAANDKSPPIALRLLNSKELLITIDIDTPNGSNSDSERITLWRGKVTEGLPMNFYVMARWDAKYGFLDVEMNGQKIVKYVGPLGQSMLYGSTYYFKYGLYHSYKDKMPDDFRFTVLLGEYFQYVF